MMPSVSVYQFILSSLNHPIYRQVHELRRPLLKKYDIPYTVLLNDQHDSNPYVPTYLPTHPDEVLYPMADSVPSMTLKFLYAVKQLFLSYRDRKDVPTYIIRSNATTYIHYPHLLQLLKNAPRERMAMGVVYRTVDTSFLSGMLMVFSKDVLWNIIMDPLSYHKGKLSAPDDWALSELSTPYADWIDLNPYFSYPDEETGVYEPADLVDKWYFRIRDVHHADRHDDMRHWKMLLSYFKELETFEGKPRSSSPPDYARLSDMRLPITRSRLGQYRR